MRSSEAIHLLDVNVILALLNEGHEHHSLAHEWMSTPGLQFALCAFSEAGVLRFFTRPSTGLLSINAASDMLNDLQQHPGYRYQQINVDWRTLTEPFRKRLHGHNQITDAYLLGLAIREGLILATLDRGIVALAGEDREHVLLLEATKRY